MASKPLILTDNLFDNVVLHPSFVVASSNADDASGHEPFRVADNLRDMTSWTVTTTNAGRTIYVDSGVGGSIVGGCIVLDRGHNLAGKTVRLDTATDPTFAVTTTAWTATIPAAPGGLPSDPNGCLTPDGVWWKTFNGVTNRVQGLTILAMGVGIAPIVTGLYLGTAYRFTEYFDAPAAYDYSTQVKYLKNDFSRGGVRVKSRPINNDKLQISIGVESTDYAAMHTEMQRINRYNVPMWFAFDDSDATGVGQVRLFQTPGDYLYDPQVNPVHREIKREFEEVIPSLYL
jgi:hypothetical protein